MRNTLGKLLIIYNKLYKSALNLNEKTKNTTVLNMQGKNQLLNICEPQTLSVIARLLISNKHFHEDKPDTQEPEAEEYLQKLCAINNLEIEETTPK